jgi:hypothetical protein
VTEPFVAQVVQTAEEVKLQFHLERLPPATWEQLTRLLQTAHAGINISHLNQPVLEPDHFELPTLTLPAKTAYVNYTFDITAVSGSTISAAHPLVFLQGKHSFAVSRGVSNIIVHLDVRPPSLFFKRILETKPATFTITITTDVRDDEGSVKVTGRLSSNCEVACPPGLETRYDLKPILNDLTLVFDVELDLPLLPPGRHVLHLQAEDASGNVGQELVHELIIGEANCTGTYWEDDIFLLQSRHHSLAL